MLQPTLRHYVFVHRFVEAVTWQPLHQALASRPLGSRAAEAEHAWDHAPKRAA